ncbi:hypothetical protein [Phenylobacterium sp.]|uniref:hypothetical protein n=1 Tax=Phenylobacterium sp. TaxID=1871053 RepID=UPI002DE68B95|nr:hypothetical protein [Phenylobacterium sp.]
MNLVDEYLRAVSVLLPKAQADDIIAELRDTILSRIEAREAELGRPLTDDETEAVLREIGHPLVVAARYREGPQHVVGPTLYPYWAFAVKLGLAIQVVAAVLVLFGRTIAGGDFGLAIGQAISSVINGAFMLVGIATLAAWFIERQGYRIGYLDEWHVRDLWFLEFVAWDWDTLRDGLAGRGWPGQRRWRRSSAPPSSSSASSQGDEPKPQAPRPEAKAERRSESRPETKMDLPPPHWSPAGHGLMLITFGTVLVLWWLRLARLDIGFAASDLPAHGFDAGPLAAVNWEGLRATLFWPVLAYGLGIVARGALLLAYPWAVRAQGFLEAASGAAVAAFGVWLWTASPLSSAVRVDGFAQFFQRLAPLDGHAVPLAPLATALVAIITVTGLCTLMRGLWDLVAGPPPAGPWAVWI